MRQQKQTCLDFSESGEVSTLLKKLDGCSPNTIVDILSYHSWVLGMEDSIVSGLKFRMFFKIDLRDTDKENGKVTTYGFFDPSCEDDLEVPFSSSSTAIRFLFGYFQRDFLRRPFFMFTNLEIHFFITNSRGCRRNVLLRQFVPKGVTSLAVKLGVSSFIDNDEFVPVDFSQLPMTLNKIDVNVADALVLAGIANTVCLKKVVVWPLSREENDYMDESTSKMAVKNKDTLPQEALDLLQNLTLDTLTVSASGFELNKTLKMCHDMKVKAIGFGNVPCFEEIVGVYPTVTKIVIKYLKTYEEKFNYSAITDFSLNTNVRSCFPKLRSLFIGEQVNITFFGVLHFLKNNQTLQKLTVDMWRSSKGSSYKASYIGHPGSVFEFPENETLERLVVEGYDFETPNDEKDLTIQLISKKFSGLKFVNFGFVVPQYFKLIIENKCIENIRLRIPETYGERFVEIAESASFDHLKSVELTKFGRWGRVSWAERSEISLLRFILQGKKLQDLYITSRLKYFDLKAINDFVSKNPRNLRVFLSGTNPMNDLCENYLSYHFTVLKKRFSEHYIPVPKKFVTTCDPFNDDVQEFVPCDKIQNEWLERSISKWGILPPYDSSVDWKRYFQERNIFQNLRDNDIIEKDRWSPENEVESIEELKKDIVDELKALWKNNEGVKLSEKEKNVFEHSIYIYFRRNTYRVRKTYVRVYSLFGNGKHINIEYDVYFKQRTIIHNETSETIEVSNLLNDTTIKVLTKKGITGLKDLERGPKWGYFAMIYGMTCWDMFVQQRKICSVDVIEKIAARIFPKVPSGRVDHVAILKTILVLCRCSDSRMMEEKPDSIVCDFLVELFQERNGLKKFDFKKKMILNGLDEGKMLRTYQFYQRSPQYPGTFLDSSAEDLKSGWFVDVDKYFKNDCDQNL